MQNTAWDDIYAQTAATTTTQLLALVEIARLYAVCNNWYRAQSSWHHDSRGPSLLKHEQSLVGPILTLKDGKRSRIYLRTAVAFRRAKETAGSRCHTTAL